jgi:hypothetical protein
MAHIGTKIKCVDIHSCQKSYVHLFYKMKVNYEIESLPLSKKDMSYCKMKIFLSLCIAQVSVWSKLISAFLLAGVYNIRSRSFSRGYLFRPKTRKKKFTIIGLLSLIFS